MRVHCCHIRFKPAPIYILDEVDAALDLNHTQNIGAMIKQHFPQVQTPKHDPTQKFWAHLRMVVIFLWTDSIA